MLEMAPQNGLVRRSDMNDTWWTAYSLLFEALMQKLQIPRAWRNSRRMTQRRQYYHLVHGYIKSYWRLKSRDPL